MPQITLLPSFGDFLTSDEKDTDQSILISTTDIENTQFVSIALTSNPEISYVQQMANNSATVTVPSSDLKQLVNGRSYSITASVANIFGDLAKTKYDFSVQILSSELGGGGVVIEDEGVGIGTAQQLNFVGPSVTASGIGSTKTITIESEGDGTMFIDHDDGSLGIVTTMNFTGLGVTVTTSNEIANVIIDGDFDGGGF
jgi:hypothetical protein